MKYRQRREFMIVFLGGKCVGCGATENLDLHHRDPSEKAFAISRFWSISWDKLILELPKCELRCRAVCHKFETRASRWRPPPPTPEYGPSDYTEPAGYAEF